MMEIMGVKYITPKEASKRYGYSVGWFQKQRSLRKDPAYVKINNRGRVLYKAEDLDSWFRERLNETEEGVFNGQ